MEEMIRILGLFALLILMIAGNVVIFAYLTARHKTRSYLFAALSTYLVVSNIVAFRLIGYKSYVVPSAIVIYSLIFLISDFLSEKFGKDDAKKAVISGFILNVLIVLVTVFIKYFPFPDFAQEQAVLFTKVFSYTPRIVLGSLVAYIVSQHISIYTYYLLKLKTKGKYMWLRNNVSTGIAQFVDTLLFVIIAFYTVIPNNFLLTMVVYHYMTKLIIAILDTPFLYLASWIYDRFS